MLQMLSLSIAYGELQNQFNMTHDFYTWYKKNEFHHSRKKNEQWCSSQFSLCHCLLELTSYYHLWSRPPKNCSKLVELKTLDATLSARCGEICSWYLINLASWWTISGLVSMCQSGSSCRTKEVRPFSVLQKRTLSFINPLFVKSPASLRADNTFSPLSSSRMRSIR